MLTYESYKNKGNVQPKEKPVKKKKTKAKKKK